MAGYLDQYGAGDEKRSTIVKRAIALIVAVIILTVVPWYLFKNHAQERKVKDFLDLLRKHDYHAAYLAWGCGEPHAVQRLSLRPLHGRLGRQEYRRSCPVTYSGQRVLRFRRTADCTGQP